MQPREGECGVLRSGRPFTVVSFDSVLVPRGEAVERFAALRAPAGLEHVLGDRAGLSRLGAIGCDDASAVRTSRRVAGRELIGANSLAAGGFCGLGVGNHEVAEESVWSVLDSHGLVLFSIKSDGLVFETDFGRSQLVCVLPVELGDVDAVGPTHLDHPDVWRVNG